MTPNIDALWLEYRTAAQYAKLWDRAEECIALIRRKEMTGTLPTQDDLGGVSFSSGNGSPAYWMQQIRPPAWFVRDELGVGTGVNVYETARSLRKTNADRRRQYGQTLKALEKARTVLARKVSG